MGKEQQRFDSPWRVNTHTTTFPTLRRDVRVDVAVIGGGIMGLTAAYLLKREGLTVAVLERDHCGAGATGSTTAHLTAVPETRLRALVDQVGADGTQVIWDAGFAALARIRSIVRDERINCRFSWLPAYLYASRRRDIVEARLELAEDVEIAHALGIDALMVDAVPGISRPGLAFENQARLHPLSYLHVLASRIPGEGSHIFENSEVMAVEDRPVALRVGDFRVRADYVVVATHWPAAGTLRDAPDLIETFGLSQSTTYAVRGTAPHVDLAPGLFWESGIAGYEYLRVDRCGEFDEVLLGGHDRQLSTAEDVAAIHAALEQRAAELAPDIRISHRWSGPIIETDDRIPVIGEVAPGRFIGTGFGGNGMTYGTLAAMMATDAIQGRKSPWADVFGLSRAKGTQWGTTATAPMAAHSLLTAGNPWSVARRRYRSGSGRREWVH